ncbi:MAG: ketopantoate reductase family protein [Gaiellaceae bacterium]
MNEIVVVGPGGIGGTFAALLARTGECSVTLLGRPGKHIDAIRSAGLRLEGLDQLNVAVGACDEPSQIASCDALFFAVKAQDTDAAIAATSHIDVRELVLSLQNGVIKDEQLAGAFGADRVVGALAVVAGERPEPGLVRWTYDGGTRIGELDGRVSERVTRLVELLERGGLTSEVSREIVAATWTKLVGWAPIGLLASLTGQDNAAVLSSGVLAREYLGMVRELAGLAAACDVGLIDLGPFRIRTWLGQSDAEALGSVMSSPLAASDSTHSALQDIRRGTPTELGALLGPLLTDAAQRSVPLARVGALYAALMGLEETLV